MSEITRLYRYKSLLSGKRAISKSELMAVLEISEATLKRDLAKLRDQLNIPVVFDRDSGGYRMSSGHSDIELPGVWFSPQELSALATIQHMLEQLQMTFIGAKLKPLEQKLSSLMKSHGLDGPASARKVRLVHAGKRLPEMNCFDTIALATLGEKQIKLTHFNRQTGRSVDRTISPYRLVHYRDNWYVDGWCHLRQNIRSFSVDAITHAEALSEPIMDVDEDQLTSILQSSYGIFTGRPKAYAVLRFSELRSRWVKQEQWHPDQVTRLLPDGKLEMEIPYSDERELIGDVLKYGADVEVLRPAELRQQIRLALASALDLYKP